MDPAEPRASRWSRAQEALRRMELHVLVAGVVVLGCAWAFFGLVNLATSESQDFDHRIFGLFHDPQSPDRLVGPQWLASTVRDYTALGSSSVVLLVIAIVTIAMLAAGNRRLPLLVMGACFSGMALSHVLKLAVARERPGSEFHAVDIATSSFPSGHTMNAAVVYVTLGALVAQGQKRRRAAVFALATGAGLAVLVGLSRVYLGVHWPTDVLGGLAAGFGWATLWFVIADRVRRRRTASSRQPAGGTP